MTDQQPYMRTRQILQLLNIGKTQWHRWVKTGHAPAGIKLSARVFVWKREDIENFIKAAPKVGANE